MKKIFICLGKPVPGILLAVLIAGVVQWISGKDIDGWMGLAVAIFILYSGAMLAKETISPLLGESASPELQRDIIGILEKEEAVLGYSH